MLFDIGGGSTELAWVRLGCGPPSLIGYASLPVGVVTLAERFGTAVFTEEGFDAMVEDVTARLVAFESVHCIGREIRNGGVRLLGTSGTVTTLAGLVSDKAGRTLVFAFMADKIPSAGLLRAAADAIDEAAAALAGCGCR